MLCPKCKLNAPKGMKQCPVCGTMFSAVALLSDEERERIHKEQEHKDREEAKKQKEADEETIYVDPSRTYMHETQNGYDEGFGFGSIFDGFFGGGLFGNMFGGQPRGRTTIKFGGGLFDIIDDLFGFGGSNGYVSDNRMRIEAPHEFYQLDEYDEEGFPIIRKDKLIDITPHQLEKMKREEEKEQKRRKRDDKH